MLPRIDVNERYKTIGCKYFPSSCKQMIEIVLKIPTMMLRIMDFLKITIVLQLIDVEQNDDVDDIILSMSLNIFENTFL